MSRVFRFNFLEILVSWKFLFTTFGICLYIELWFLHFKKSNTICFVKQAIRILNNFYVCLLKSGWVLRMIEARITTWVWRCFVYNTYILFTMHTSRHFAVFAKNLNFNRNYRNIYFFHHWLNLSFNKVSYWIKYLTN